MNPTDAKQKQHKSWTQVAEGWNKHDDKIRAMTAPVTERMLSLAGLRAGMRVLDIACGAGEPALTAAEKVAPSGSVLATDFVEDMVQFARGKAKQRALTNVEFRCVDGECIDIPHNAFDAVTMRWGLMFMPDPVACMRRVHAALKPGSKAVVACWTEAAHNPFVTVPLGVLKRHMEIPDPPPGAPGIFALGNSERLRAIYAEAGFRDIAIEQVKVNMADFADGHEYETYTREIAGPVASLFVQLPAEKQRIVQQEIARESEARSAVPGRVVLHGVTHVAVGVR